MDDRELYNDPEELLRAAMEAQQAGLWTATPGIVQSFDLAKMTAVIQPAIRAKVTQPDGTQQSVALPLLLDCPVVFPQGGGYTLTFPVAAGDECLVVFAARCIDAWWQLGGVQEQVEFRMHDLSDGFALLGIRSVPRALPAIDSDSAQLRSDDGATFVEVGAGQVTVKAAAVTVNCDTAQVNATTSLLVNSPLSTFTGAVTVQGLLTYLAGLAGAGGGVGSNITGDITQTGGVLSSSGTALHTHTHSGVQTGTGHTGVPD